MEFAFSEEQDAFRSTLRRFFEERWPLAEVRRLAETPEGFDREVWKQLGEELGLTGLAIPEAHGGQGFGFLELGIALEEMGRQLAGGPFLAHVGLAARAIGQVATEAQRAQLLPALASGDTLATLACTEATGASAAAGIRAECRRDGGRWLVSGTQSLVLAGDSADLILVLARQPGSTGADGISLLTVRPGAPGLEVRPAATLDLTRRQADLELRDVPAELLGEPGAAWPGVARALDEATILLGAEMVGSAARCLEMAVGYAKERVQFARPIGSFQAIKHKVAEVMLELESARSAAYWSWWVADQESPDPGQLAEAASLVKSVCSDAFERAAVENLQIHGGVGFTWEFDCHLFLRRAKACEVLLGDPVAHRQRLAACLGLEGR